MWEKLLAGIPWLKYWKLGLIGLSALILIGVFLYLRHIVSQNTEYAQTIQTLNQDNANLKAAQETIIKSQKVRDGNAAKVKTQSNDVNITQLHDAGWLRND